MVKFEIKSTNQIIQPQLLRCNLTLIETDLPRMIVVIMNLNFKLISLFDLIKLLENENPIKYDDTQGHRFYYAKLIKFVNAVLSGLNANDVWSGVVGKRLGMLGGNHVQYDLDLLSRVCFELVVVDADMCKLVLCFKLEAR